MNNPREWRVMLVVADLVANIAFYENILGLKVVSRWDYPHGAGAILSLGPGRSLELRGRSPSGKGPSGAELAGGSLMLGIEVADVDAAHDQLVGQGVAITRPLKDNPWGDRSFAIADPNGIRVWIYTLTNAELAAGLGVGG